MKPILFVVGSTTAYKIHKPFADFCVRQGRTVAFLYDREPDALFEQIQSDAKALGATAASLDAEIDAGPHEVRWGFFSRPPNHAKAFDAGAQATQHGSHGGICERDFRAPCCGPENAGNIQPVRRGGG